MKNQINKEALFNIFLYFFYFFWWFYFAYIYPPKNVEDYKYVLGLPDWFFYSCVLGFVLVNLLVYIVVKFFFKNIDLETGEVIEENE